MIVQPPSRAQRPIHHHSMVAMGPKVGSVQENRLEGRFRFKRRQELPREKARGGGWGVLDVCEACEHADRPEESLGGVARRAAGGRQRRFSESSRAVLLR